MKSKKSLIFAMMVLVSIVISILAPKKTFAVNKGVLDESKKLVIDSIKPTNYMEFYDYVSHYLMTEIDGIEDAYPSNENSDYTMCDINMVYSNGKTETKQGISLEYKSGDNSVKSKVDDFAKKIPKEKTFNLNDLEIINYWVNGYDKNDNTRFRDTMGNYSGELKNALNNSNISISFTTATGAGEYATFFNSALGDAVLSFNGTVYAKLDFVGTRINNIIYVPDSTGNSKEDLIEAAQKRIDEYLGAKGKAVISYEGSVLDTCLKYYYENNTEWKEMDENMTFDEYKNSPFRPAIDVEYETGIKGINENSNSFAITINGIKHNLIIEKNSAKMIKPSYKTTDLNTNVEISSTSSAIPLDTSIKAEKLTSGTEYDKIIKILDVEDNETFDLKLYSTSTNKNITKLDNGTFDVKIPVADKLRGKTLMAYYIDSNNKIIEYEVTVKDGYATFTTDHFSIYTLAEKKAVEKITNNTPNQTEKEKNAAGEKDETPETGTVDITGSVLGLTIISVLGIIVLNKKEIK